MRHFLMAVLAHALCVFATAASASYHTWEIWELYSNEDGTIQFVVLHEFAGENGQDLLGGHQLSVKHGASTKTFDFPHDLPNPNTAGRYILIATQGYVDVAATYPQFAAALPDYVIPNQFLPTDGGSLNYADVDQVTFGPLPTDGLSALFTPSTSDAHLGVNEARTFAGEVSTVPILAVTAIEYYNATLRHYFISNLQPDIDALDSGRIAGWSRTGGEFYVFAGARSDLSPVCRYYIPPEHGNSHFFSASPAECATIQNLIASDPNYSGYILETSEVFYIHLPDPLSGTCPAQSIPVYRLWNGRADSNHRYTTDPNVKAQMLAIGYVAEGYGPNAVAMCSPV